MTAGTLTSEKLVQLCLARIDAFDRKGPSLHAVLTLNPKALDTARALDAERKAKGPRSPLHGIPIVLKDNFDTFDMPTTGGSVLLEGSIPPDDAFVVKKLRDAGAIILAKVNMSEFASGAALSSLGGQTLNPHDLARTPSGSSGGTGASVAAGYALAGLGTDTGGSVRGPSTSNGIVGLKPTLGLLSRDGIIPLALTFDTAGPMARSVSDLATVLGAMTGVDRGRRGHRRQPGPLGNRLHEVPEGRRAEGRPHRRGPRFLRRGRRRGLGDGGGARRDAPRRRDDGGRPLSEVAARRQGRLLHRGAVARVRAADRQVPRHDRPALPEDAGRDDRALEAVHVHSSGRRDAEPAALGVVRA